MNFSTPITNNWHNKLAKSLNIFIDDFLIFQPSVIINNETDLHINLNLIPTESHITSGKLTGNQTDFYTQYMDVIKKLPAYESGFEHHIGSENHTKWKSYLNSLSAKPKINEMPSIWFSWAMIHAPAVANVGRSDLSRQIINNTFDR